MTFVVFLLGLGCGGLLGAVYVGLTLLRWLDVMTPDDLATWQRQHPPIDRNRNR